MKTTTHQCRRAVIQLVVSGMLLGTVVTTEAVSPAAASVSDNVATR